MLKRMCVIGLVILFTARAYATEPVMKVEEHETKGEYSSHESIKKGWYWYKEEEPAEETEEKKEKEKPVSLSSLSVDELKKVLEERLKLAIDDPTPDNVLAYIKAKDVALKKSLAFANTYSLVIQMHPEFTNAGYYPVANPGINALYSMRTEEIESTIKNTREEFALIYFYSPDCRFCRVKNMILRYFVDKYGWEVKKVNILEESEAATRFNVFTVPYIMIVYRDTGKYMPATVGVASLAELEHAIFRAIRYMKGVTSPSNFTFYDYNLGSPVDPTQILSTVKGNR